MVKFDYSRENSALLSGSFYLMRAILAPIVGRLAMKYSKRKIFLIIGSCLHICTVIIIYVLQPSTPLIFVFILNLISGTGAGNYGKIYLYKT